MAASTQLKEDMESKPRPYRAETYRGRRGAASPLRGEGSARTDVCVPSFSVKKSLWPYKDILTAEMAHTQQGSE